jgi:hypothetical protein
MDVTACGGQIVCDVALAKEVFRCAAHARPLARVPAGPADGPPPYFTRPPAHCEARGSLLTHPCATPAALPTPCSAWRLADPQGEALDNPGAPLISPLPHPSGDVPGGPAPPLAPGSVPWPSAADPPPRGLAGGVAAMRRAWEAGAAALRGDGGGAGDQGRGGGGNDIEAQLVSRTLSGTTLHGRHFAAMSHHHNPLFHGPGGAGRPPLPTAGWRGGGAPGAPGGPGSVGGGGGTGGSVAGDVAGGLPTHGVPVKAFHIGTFIFKGCNEPVEMVWVTSAALEARAGGLACDEAALDKGGPKGRRIEAASGPADGAVAPAPDVLDGLRDTFLRAAGDGEGSVLYAQWGGLEWARGGVLVGAGATPMAGGRGRSFTMARAARAAPR